MSRNALSMAVLLSAVVLAGCASAPPPTSGPMEQATLPMAGLRTGEPVGPDLDATTAAAPRLIVGEWWRIRFDGALYTGEDLLRVVANATRDGYVFGMPHSAWMKEAIAYHAPAFGDVGTDLSYEVHNARFEPLRFPLVAGSSWTTAFGGAEYTATVETADEHTATIRFQPPESTDPTAQLACLAGVPCDGSMRMTYDARQHEVVHMESALGNWSVTEHGYQFQGWVTVPKGMHTAIDHGTFGVDPNDPMPTSTVHVDDGFNRLTLLQAVFALTPGYYSIASTAPDGQVFKTELVGSAGVKFDLFETSAASGDWHQQVVAGGVGGSYTMGLAYQQYDILVPEGSVRPMHGHEVER